MRLNPPSWWQSDNRLWPVLLAPVAFVWSGLTRLRSALAKPYRAPVPVICIGNLTAGGAGKTPAAIAAARLLQEAGERPVVLTRGYGGRANTPHVVDPDADGARDVGDEALLLARTAPVVVAGDRAAGARRAAELDATVIVMDDGFQNPSLDKDLSLVAVDRAMGIGNGRVMPAGPLRAPLEFQLTRADGFILIGEGHAADTIAAAAKAAGKPVFEAELTPSQDRSWMRGRPVVAFAGIGNPQKFFRMLQRLGARLVASIAFPDHHPFSGRDARRLLELARREGAELATTEKDQVRLEGSGVLEELRQAARAVPVELRFADLPAVKRLLKSGCRVRPTT